MRSQKEKRFEKLQSITSGMKNTLRIRDFGSILDGFNQLVTELEKSESVLKKEPETPVFIVRCLVQIEDSFLEVTNPEKKKLSQANQKSLGTLKNRFKKFAREGYEEKLAAFREKPVWSADEKESEDEEERGP